MNGSVRLWPYDPRYALASAPAIFVIGLFLLGIARSAFGFAEKPESGTLWVLLLVSLVPVVLLLLDAVLGRGATIEYVGIKLAIAGGATPTPTLATVPTNIGVSAGPVTDSGTEQILNALRGAIGTEIAIVDLESGKAWWETRLLVLIAGAERHGRPAGIAFLANVGGVAGCFQGWGEPAELLPALLDANDTYRLCYIRASAAAAQWDLLEPADQPGPPLQPPWMSGLAARYLWMAFTPGSNLPNPFAREQLLANELGQQIEMPTGTKSVNALRLRELFIPVLHEENIDEDSLDDEKVDAFLKARGRYVAVTRAGVFQRLIAKEAGQAALIRSLLRPRSSSADSKK